MAIKPYLQLVRLPNVFTAAADSLAGWLLVAGTFDGPGRWLPLPFASMAIYAAGIALNDVFDYDLDRQERPGRPLPSGAVSRRFAARLGGLLLALGPALAALTGSWASLAVASALAVSVLAYDAALRRTALGPELMGVCRGLNLLLGMSPMARLDDPGVMLAAGSFALFVAGVTWISRSETESGHRSGIASGVALEAAGIAGLAWVALDPRAFLGSQPAPTGALGVGLPVLLAVAAVVGRADLRALLTPQPATVQKAVKTGVLSLVWLNVALVAAVRGPAPALAVAALWVPAFLLGRWLYST